MFSPSISETSECNMERTEYKARLKEYPMEYRFKLPIIRECISQSIDTGQDWHPADAAKAYACLEMIVRNLMSNPYRKMYHELKVSWILVCTSTGPSCTRKDNDIIF